MNALDHLYCMAIGLHELLQDESIMHLPFEETCDCCADTLAEHRAQLLPRIYECWTLALYELKQCDVEEMNERINSEIAEAQHRIHNMQNPPAILVDAPECMEPVPDDLDPETALWVWQTVDRLLDVARCDLYIANAF